MPSLLEIYRDILQSDDKNCYYYESSKKSEMSEDAELFIKNYFEKAGKQDLYIDIVGKINIPAMRYEHMRSVFLLGIHFYDNVAPVRENINEMIKNVFLRTIAQNNQYEIKEAAPYPYDKNTIPHDELRRDFLYYWFLICLSHDLGYLYERPINNVPSDAEFIRTQIGTDLRQYGRKDDIFGIPPEYCNAAALYYQLRMSCPLFRRKSLVLDHGICGGIKLYKALKEAHVIELGSDCHIQCRDHHREPNRALIVGKPIFDNYIVPAAWTIICHNIRSAEETSDTAERYRSFGLSNLITKEGKPLIHLDKHPLLFLLCLVDTIEPIKKFITGNPKTIDQTVRDSIFGNILIEITNKNSTIKIRQLSEEIDSTCRNKSSCQENHEGFTKCSSDICHKQMEKDLGFLKSASFIVSAVEDDLVLHFKSRYRH